MTAPLVHRITTPPRGQSRKGVGRMCILSNGQRIYDAKSLRNLWLAGRRRLEARLAHAWREEQLHRKLDELRVLRERVEDLEKRLGLIKGKDGKYLGSTLSMKKIEEAIGRIPDPKLLALYLEKMDPLEPSPSGMFKLRVFDGMDGCWSDVDVGTLAGMLELWCERTKNGTEKTCFDDIDYYMIFPADTTMHYDGSPGREMFRSEEEYRDPNREGSIEGEPETDDRDGGKT